MSEEAKIVAFVSFCVEAYKTAKHIGGDEASLLFAKYGVDSYLYEEYEILHTMGIEMVLDYINRFLEVRGVKV